MNNNNFFKMMLIIVAVVYFVAPDFLPGPIDDVIALVFALNYTGGNKQISKND